MKIYVFSYRVLHK